MHDLMPSARRSHHPVLGRGALGGGPTEANPSVPRLDPHFPAGAAVLTRDGRRGVIVVQGADNQHGDAIVYLPDVASATVVPEAELTRVAWEGVPQEVAVFVYTTEEPGWFDVNLVPAMGGDPMRLLATVRVRGKGAATSVARKLAYGVTQSGATGAQVFDDESELLSDYGSARRYRNEDPGDVATMANGAGDFDRHVRYQREAVLARRPFTVEVPHRVRWFDAKVIPQGVDGWAAVPDLDDAQSRAAWTAVVRAVGQDAATQAMVDAAVDAVSMATSPYGASAGGSQTHANPSARRNGPFEESDGRAHSHTVTVHTDVTQHSVPFLNGEVASVALTYERGFPSIKVEYTDGRPPYYYDSVHDLLFFELYGRDYAVAFNRHYDTHYFEREQHVPLATMAAFIELQAAIVAEQFARDDIRADDPKLVQYLHGQWHAHMHRLPGNDDRAMFDRFVDVVRTHLAAADVKLAATREERREEREANKEWGRRNNELQRAAAPIVAAAEEASATPGFNLLVHRASDWKEIDRRKSIAQGITRRAAEYGFSYPATQTTSRSGVVYELAPAQEPLGKRPFTFMALFAKTPDGVVHELARFPGLSGNLDAPTNVARLFEMRHRAAAGERPAGGHRAAPAVAAPRLPAHERQGSFTFANGPYRGLTVAERDAVRAYAADHGRGWRRDLADDWSRGRATGDLQRLRNDLGPSWLSRATLPNGPGAGTYPNRASAHLLADLDDRGRRDLALDLMQYTALPDVVHLWGSYEDSQFDRAALVQKLAAVYERAYGDVMYVLTGRRLNNDFWVTVVRDDVFNQIEQAGFEGRSLPNGGDRLPPLAYSADLQSYQSAPRLPPLAYGAGSDGDPYAGRDLYPGSGYGDLATPTALRPRFGRRGL